MRELIWAVLIFLPSLTTQQCLTASDSKPMDVNAREYLSTGEQQFTLNMIKLVNRQRQTENVFFSPFSIYNALLLAYFTANGNTEASVKHVLGLPANHDKANTMQVYKLERYYQKAREYNTSSYEFAMANRLFISPTEEVKECMKSLFEEEIKVTDFTKNPVKEINQWVANLTRDQIKDFLPENSLDSNSKLALVNAAYFKGMWTTKFVKGDTKKEVFYISNSNTTFVTMMKVKSTFNHMVSEKLGAHILELPYQGDAISMFIMLPPFASPNGVTNILERLTLNNLKEVIHNNTVSRLVEVKVPKFTIEHELDLVPVLEQLNVGDLFKDTSDLSGLTGKKGIHLDSALHKSKVSLDEDGTTAASATAFFSFRSSRPLEPARFYCNHPFVYFIYDHISRNILFIGVFNKPTETAT